MVQTTFSKNVLVYQVNPETGETVNDSNGPIVEETLGVFVFRRPTIKDELDMGVERVRLAKGVEVIKLDPMTRVILEFQIRFPRLVERAPDGWSWDIYDVRKAFAISAAFAQGFDEIATTGECRTS